MKVENIVKVTLLIGFIETLTEAAWTEPYFRRTERDDVIFGEYLEGFGQQIRMDEEINIDPPIAIAVVTNYEGTQEEPVIQFLEGRNVTIGLQALKVGSEWVLVVTRKQDYENEDMRFYYLLVKLDKTSVRILLDINNIFDNPPVITANTMPCSAEELRENFATNCTFNVFDPDGFKDNKISFAIDGKFDESELFRFDYSKQNDLYNMEYVLFIQKKLYFNQRNLYNFKTTVRDVANNTGSINVILNVEDVPSEDPIWTKFFATAQFPEKSKQEFQVRAIDGDTGINKTICYKLQFDESKNYTEISIEKDTGKIYVEPINRDEYKIEFYPFQIIAFKCDNESWAIVGNAAFIVEDINDNYPEIFLPYDELEFDEESFYTNIFSSSLFVDDIDLGANATYDVILSQQHSEIQYSDAFIMIPSTGYQRQKFDVNIIKGISVIDEKPVGKLMDYEDRNWQDFQIDIIATEQEEKSHRRMKSFRVKLLNWNDEIPSFEMDDYTFSVNETIEINQPIGALIKAIDRDIDDEIRYSLVGRISDYISCQTSADGCKLYTLLNDSFDYERQKEVIFQIKAQDTLQTKGEPTHEVYAQVHINVLDVNDETPQLTMPRDILEIRENVRDALITQNIIATDPDTTADLRLEIDWENSYASKPGFNVEREFFEGCFIIEKMEENRNKVFGVLRVNSSFQYNIDYEKYEIVYVNLKVIDWNQEVNSNQSTAILTVRILDENDNPPEFVGNTLEVERNVVEEAATGSLVGNIAAIDIDGPGNNIITYDITPIKNTPDNLIRIDSATGVITVKADREIDCDVPKREFLEYTILLNDGANETRGDIKIKIIDINNKIPQVSSSRIEVSLYENATNGDLISDITANDLDRDVPHNVIEFRINYLEHPNLQKYFLIHATTGRLEVNGNYQLDRDHGEDTHLIYINLEDNYLGNGARNQNQTMVVLTLLDVNDNAPEMPSITEFTVNENVKKAHIITSDFYAKDIDDPNTPNSKVSYKILSIEPAEKEESTENEHSRQIAYEQLFEIKDDEDLKYGILSTGKDLKGFHGDWNVTIFAFDHGDEWDSRISLNSTKQFTIHVTPFNFYQPEIIFPTSNTNIRLDFNKAHVGKNLVKVNGKELELFEAVDDDGGVFGDVTFEIISALGNGDEEFFEVLKMNRKTSQLILKKNVIERTYNLNVKATDGGGKSSDSRNVRITFINMTGEPYFSPNVWSTDFTENDEGRDEKREIPKATDPKNIDTSNPEEMFRIYYFINLRYNPQDAEFFQLDKENRILTLKKELDRETIDFHVIQVLATNSIEYPEKPSSENSLLTINITVNDVNDNPPKFTNQFYAVGISPTDAMDKILIRLHAHDPDLNDVVTYYLLNNTLKTIGKNIEDIKETAFKVNENSGELMLNFIPQSSMSGHFEFQVQARDLVNHTDEAFVKIFIVADANRVIFVFLNNVDEVRKINVNSIAAIFTQAYGFDCNIDDIVTADREGVAQNLLTNIRAHFIENNEPVEARQIQEKSSDVAFMTNLKSALLAYNLNLQDVPTKSSNEMIVNEAETLALVLMVLSIILGILCILITMAFFFRTKGLKRQIKALSENTIQTMTPENQRKTLPNTNHFAFEKSNPVLNKNQLANNEMDNKSISSNDSDDLADVRNNPMFKQRHNNVKNPIEFTNNSSSA